MQQLAEQMRKLAESYAREEDPAHCAVMDKSDSPYSAGPPRPAAEGLERALLDTAGELAKAAYEWKIRARREYREGLSRTGRCRSGS